MYIKFIVIALLTAFLRPVSAQYGSQAEDDGNVEVNVRVRTNKGRPPQVIPSYDAETGAYGYGPPVSGIPGGYFNGEPITDIPAPPIIPPDYNYATPGGGGLGTYNGRSIYPTPPPSPSPGNQGFGGGPKDFSTTPPGLSSRPYRMKEYEPSPNIGPDNLDPEDFNFGVTDQKNAKTPPRPSKSPPPPGMRDASKKQGSDRPPTAYTGFPRGKSSADEVSDEPSDAIRPTTNAKGSPSAKPTNDFPYKDAINLYSSFGAYQIPKRTKFIFKGLAIPPGSPCSNTKKLDLPKSKASCTACVDDRKTTKEARELKTYDLESIERGFGTTTRNLIFKFKGKSGPITFTCADVNAEESLPTFAEGLKKMGVDLTFQKPGEASLQPARTGGAGSTSAH